MPYYTTGPIGADVGLADMPSSLGDSVATAFEDAVRGNPTKVAYDYLGYAKANSGEKLADDDAAARIKAAGVPLKVPTGGITEDALGILIDRKRDEIARQSILARAPSGVVASTSRFGAGIVGSLLDPLNVAAAFIPVVGEARYAELLANASGAAGRLGVRAGVGALEGAAGAAAIEPINYFGRTQMQDDYHMTDSLLNLAFGAGLGAGLHGAGGAIGDSLGISKFARDERQRFIDRVQEERMRIEGAQPDAPVSIPSLLQKQIDAAESARSQLEGGRLSDAQIGESMQRRIEANPEQAVRDYASLPGTDGGRILNTDEARELSPDYRADRTRSAAVHEPASAFVKNLYEQKLAGPTPDGQAPLVLFTAGGTGAGKSSALRAMGEAAQRAEMIYDTNMNSLASARKKIEQALAAGRDARIMYVYRDPVEALTGGALPRAMRMGRTVPLREHARTHAGASETVRELATLYKDDPRVSIEVYDNSHGPGGGRLSSLAEVPEVSYNGVERRLQDALDHEHADGRISDAVYRGTSGSEIQPDARTAGADGQAPAGVSGQPEQGRAPGSASQVTPAADTVSAATPETRQAAARAAIGQAMDGRAPDVEPLFRNSGDPVADAVESSRRQADPQSVLVADPAAARAADERIAAAPKPEDAAEAARDAAAQRLDDLVTNLKARGFDEKQLAAIKAELQPFRDAVADSEKLGSALRAAAVCGLK